MKFNNFINIYFMNITYKLFMIYSNKIFSNYKYKKMNRKFLLN